VRAGKCLERLSLVSAEAFLLPVHNYDAALVPMSIPLKLVYLDFRGAGCACWPTVIAIVPLHVCSARGEASRLCFVVGGVQFEDKRIAWDDIRVMREGTHECTSSFTHALSQLESFPSVKSPF
jgi:hypothetical protein